MRLVLVKIRPHVSKGKRCSWEGKTGGGSSGIDSDGILRIATNLLDVPAEIIALLDAYRWTIEIFYQPPVAASASSNICWAAATC